MDRDPYIGRMLGGRYQLESLLGRGGFGAVYRARHVALGRTVAVKLNLHLHKPELIARFEREARVMANLRHPRCVTLLDYGDEDGLTFMVQEFVDGTTLARALAGQTRMALPRAVAIIDGVLDALAAAHKMGVVHRDIKPGNVMLVREDGEEDVRVLDFGIAKVFDEEGDPTQLTASGRAIGTPSYMSPEQIKGRVIGPSTDIYSTGVLLFHLITGLKPYRGDSIFDVYRAHLEDVPPTREMGIPDALGYVIQRAMAKDPAARFPSAAAMRGALQAALHAVEATVPTTSLLQDTIESGPPGSISGESGPPGSISGVTDSALVAASVEWDTTPPERPRPWPLAAGILALLFAGLAWTWSEQAQRDGATARAPEVLDAGRQPDLGAVDGMAAAPPVDALVDAEAPDAAVDAIVDAVIDATPPPKKRRRRPSKPAWLGEVEKARKAIDGHRYIEAERRLKYAHQLARKEVLPLLELGKLYNLQQRFDRAIPLLQKTRERHKTHEELLYRLALAHFEMGKNDYLYLYRDRFPNGRFREGVDQLIGPPVDSVPAPLDIR